MTPTRNNVEPTTSATERLRELLDERGVEWWPSDERWNADVITHWRVGAMQWTAIEGEKGLWLNAGIADHEPLTPEQAIAATLGSCNCTNDCTNSERTETCHNISKVMDEHGQARFVCSECGAWIDSRMLWNPEYRNGESPWVSGCKLNYCPNCGRRIEVDDG